MRRIVTRIALSLIFGGLLFWLAVREVQWARITEAIRAAELVYLIPYVGSLLLIHLFRTLRWGELLRPVGKVSFGKLLAVSSVGLGAIALLPLRLGEFVRPILIRDGEEIRLGSALATIATERIVDGLLVAGLIFVLLVTLGEGSGLDPVQVANLRFWGTMFGSVFLTGLLVLMFAYYDRKRFEKVLVIFPGPLRRIVSGIVLTFADGLGALRSARAMGMFMVYTLGYWAVNGLGMYMLFRAFHLPMTVGASFAVMAFIVIGIFIPGGPGFLGNFELFGKWGLLIFLPLAVVDSAGTAYILVLHMTQLVTQTAIAVAFIGSPHLSNDALEAARKVIKGESGGVQLLAPDAGAQPEAEAEQGNESR